jgi:hypothetical protein
MRISDFFRRFSRWAFRRDAPRSTFVRRRQARPALEFLEGRVCPSGGDLLSTYIPGPLALISNPDPLANCPAVPILPPAASAEPYVAVNPANPQNIAAAWIGHGGAGNADSASFDGGQTWQNVFIPGITQCTGGTNLQGANNWLSFAPNGDLYSIGLGAVGGPWLMLVSKSTDGGRTWSPSPIQVNTIGNPAHVDDKPSITADPSNSNYVYATWARLNPSFGAANRMETMFARSTDGGRTWQPEQSIHQASSGNLNYGQQIVVLPDGTLIDAFTEGQFKNNHQAALTLLRSTDHGQTWSAPIAAAVQQPLVDPNAQPATALVTDPDTGQGIETHPMFPSIAVDRNSGNLYAVWLDARFSNLQYNGIAFSMSSDGGLTWSTPIQVNQTPSTVPPIDRQAWNPAVAVAANGKVAVSYYDFRNNTAALGALTDYWLAYAPVPATNPTAWREVRLTDSSFNLEQAPTRFNGAFFLGDYEGLAAAGNDFVATWSMPDGTSTGQESIFFRRAVLGSPLEAASIGHTQVNVALTSQQVAALLPEAIHRWQATGIDTSAPHGIDIRVADLGGTMLGVASGHTVWLDDNAAGWGWFVMREVPGDNAPDALFALFTVERRASSLFARAPVKQ